LRPMTPSGQPAIGRVTALDNLYAAVGHYTDGVILGLSTGEVVRELIVGDGAGRGALTRYDAAGFLSDPAEPDHGNSAKPAARPLTNPSHNAHPGTAYSWPARQLPRQQRAPNTQFGVVRASPLAGLLRTQSGGSARGYHRGHVSLQRVSQ